jgi:hypothetical protein
MTTCGGANLKDVSALDTLLQEIDTYREAASPQGME